MGEFRHRARLTVPMRFHRKEDVEGIPPIVLNYGGGVVGNPHERQPVVHGANEL